MSPHYNERPAIRWLTADESVPSPPFLFGFCAHRAVVTMTSAVRLFFFFFLFCGESSLQRARQAVSLVVSVSPRLKRMVETVLLDKNNK